MTKKERALKNLKQMCSDGRYLGSGSYAPLEVLEDFNLAIKAIEQKSILDKVKQAREEIENLNLNDYGDNLYQFQAKCTEILDKLIESEDK